ncbi:diacylglycerol kinase family protein [Streptomyces sp. K1PA1]|uniref:Diacylglycerol kinase family protein n=1 Tax=Streptomyces tropicalis TaxID=3034234 RepID=A0ABT6A1Y0_9ACTN|nr:diacylglycerol kinase family protein [Streptomyces tropicalis]MDF3298649.1 diacylglycerol kinase family protein [Streptomyces tropicalis]
MFAAALVPPAAAGAAGAAWVLLGVAGLVLAAAGLWWALAHAGLVRIAGLVLVVAAPLAVLALYARHGLLMPAVLSLALWALALAAARVALTPRAAASPPPEAAVAPPLRPWVAMNPRSGDGKVARFRLAERARAAGADVVLLDPGGHDDVAERARQAVRDGADLLAVAGGDGTQALVAEVAAAHDLPFLVIPAGTRNHFALDLGLDREDPAAALEALTDGVELRVDLGFAADRVFVNNASFGVYAAVVGDPAYREEKLRTTLQALPPLLTGDAAPRLRMRAGATRLDGLQALLVSNNPYRRFVDTAHPGRRERLDSGLLGVLCVRVDNAAEAVGVLAGAHAPDTPDGPGEGPAAGVLRLTAPDVVVEADTPTVAVGIDGESVRLPAPVVCRIVPGALRVRVPRRRPGTPPRRPPADWRRVRDLARHRTRTGG